MEILIYSIAQQMFILLVCMNVKSVQSSKKKSLIITLVGSFMLPRPLIRTRHSVVASTRLREFPLGPSNRPTKLYCNNKMTSDNKREIH